ncbi:MAG TPA: hypothetical protein DCG69_05540 [Bacteroidales bacterium]|nr:hypothetical protein [Bacteroidales bacterium]
MKSRSFRHSVYLLILFLNIGYVSNAQERNLMLKGTVRCSENYEYISFAQIKNEMLNLRSICNEQGDFSIPITKGDLLKITAIGYEDGFYIVEDTGIVLLNFPIQLKPRIYELKELTLTPYKTVLQFKHAFAQLQLANENSTTQLNFPPLTHIRLPSAEPGHLAPLELGGPITALYNTFSHKGKMEKKYRNLIETDTKMSLIKTRLSFPFVSSIVPIASNQELDDFIDFCQFNLEYLLAVSDYVLLSVIQEKYRKFNESKILKPALN